MPSGQQPDSRDTDRPKESDRPEIRAEPGSAAVNPTVLRALERLEAARQGVRDRTGEAGALHEVARALGVDEIPSPPSKFPVERVTENLATLADRIRPKLVDAGKNSDLILSAVLGEIVACIRDEGGFVGTKLGTWKIDIRHYGMRRSPNGGDAFFVPPQWCLSFNASPTVRETLASGVAAQATASPATKNDIRRLMAAELKIPIIAGKAGKKEVGKMTALEKFFATQAGAKSESETVQVTRPIESGRVVRAFFGAVLKLIDQRGKLDIEGFGVFERKTRSGEFRDPNAAAGAKIQISGRPYVSFEPHPELLKQVLPAGRPPSKPPGAAHNPSPSEGDSEQ